MPTGCKSVYLSHCQHPTILSSVVQVRGVAPARDFKGSAKDLGTYKLCHVGLRVGAAEGESPERNKNVET